MLTFTLSARSSDSNSSCSCGGGGGNFLNHQNDLVLAGKGEKGRCDDGQSSTSPPPSLSLSNAKRGRRFISKYNDDNNCIERCNLRFFYNLLTALWTVSNMKALVAQAQLCVNHMQHIEHLSGATCHVPCSMKGQLSYLVWQHWNPIYFSFILLAEPLTDEGWEETGVPKENPWQQASENAT